MNNIVTRMSPIAAAIALSLGSLTASAQDDIERAESAIEQQAERAGSAIEQGAEHAADTIEQTADRAEDAIVEGPAQAQEAIEQRAERADTSGMGVDQIATRNSNLSTFVDAVKAAGLEESLTDGTDYTLFAPTNDAFEGQDLESLMKPENRDQLVSMLRAHIVADDLDRDLAGTIEQARTIDGGMVDVSVDGDKLMLGDVEASLDDGIQLGHLRVYAVDGVLEPRAVMPEQDRQAANRPAQ